MKKTYLRWIKRLQDTQEHEINCSECQDRISRYVDLELTADSAERQMPEVSHHLAQCGVCREEYLVLHDLARLEIDGRLPSAGELRARLARPDKPEE